MQVGSTGRGSMNSRTRKLAGLLCSVAAVSMVAVAGAPAQTTISHKGGVAKDSKAKVSFQVTKSPEGALQGVVGFKIKKLRVDCAGDEKRVTITAGSTSLSGEDLANEGSFVFTENDLEGSYQISGTVKRQGAKAKGSFTYSALSRGPKGPIRCTASGTFKTKAR